MRGSNPALNPGAFTGVAGTATAGMTVQGTINKTGILMLLTMASASWTWSLAGRDPASVGPLVLLGLLGGLVFALATVFAKRWAPVTAPLYALLEGLVLGGVSALYNAASHGIAIQAVGLTFGTLVVMLLAYSTGLIRVTQRFRTVVVAATGAIALFYLVSLALGFFNVQVPLLYSGGTVGILFSVAVVIVAAFNLALDFNFIQAGAAAGAPRFMEWYGAFGVMVTLIWLYLEILRLLSKLRSR
ncbi:MAG TPA: Bax inhibitor-1/YccA family protein [Thermoanaerobaculia bacterium]|nr:Bax inhibitor-1/YccA family protein [Thermoanaerobaculia bacterium]